MIIDRPTPATRNGLGNVIRGWPRWMLCQAVKKQKLCSSWRVKKTYSVGIVKSAACCTCFSLVIILHIKYLHPLVSMPFCAAPLPSSLLPWRLICNSVRLRVLGNIHTLFCNATPVPGRTGRTKVALVELPTGNMFGFFFCTPFPLRILAWSFVVPRSNFHPPKALSFVVPRSNFHPPKALNLTDVKAGDHWPSHTCHTKWTWKCDPRLT